jgi:hypothetical protein
MATGRQPKKKPSPIEALSIEARRTIFWIVLGILTLIIGIIWVLSWQATITRPLGLLSGEQRTENSVELESTIRALIDQVAEGINELQQPEAADFGLESAETNVTPTGFDQSLVADWQTYRNNELGFSIKYLPATTVSGSGLLNRPAINFDTDRYRLTIQVDRDTTIDFTNYYFFDFNPIGTTNIDAEPALIFTAPDGYCDATSCTDPFRAYVVQHRNTVYQLIFYGGIALTDNQQLQLFTFQFVQ